MRRLTHQKPDLRLYADVHGVTHATDGYNGSNSTMFCEGNTINAELAFKEGARPADTVTCLWCVCRT